VAGLEKEVEAMIRRFLVCSIFACAGVSASAGVVTIDFETEDDFPAPTPLANAQVLDTEFGNLISISSLDPFGSGHRGPTIFDSAVCPGGANCAGLDFDLAVGLGNIVILQNATIGTFMGGNFYIPPNDEAGGGTVVFDFLVPNVTMMSVDLIDINGGAATDVVVTDGMGRTRTYAVPQKWTHDISVSGPDGYKTLDLTTLANQPGEVVPGGPFDATATEMAGFDATDVVRISIEFSGSGAMDNLVFDVGCLSAADCSDGMACTQDVCNADGSCSNPPVDCSSMDTQCSTFACDPAGADGNCAAETDISTDCSPLNTQCATFACDPNGTAPGNCEAETDITTDCAPLNTQCATFACDPSGTAPGNCEAETDITTDCTPLNTQCATFACDPSGTAPGNCEAETDITTDCTPLNTQCATFACDPGGTAPGNCEAETDVTTDCTPLNTQCATFACDPAGTAPGNCEAETDITTDCTPLNTQCATFACDPSGTAPGNCEAETDITTDCTPLNTQCATFACDPAGTAPGNCEAETDITTDCAPLNTQCATFACDPSGTAPGNCEAETDITTDCTPLNTQCATFACDPAGTAPGNCEAETDITTNCTPLNTQCAIFACDPAGTAPGNCEAETDITTDCSFLGSACETYSCDPSGATPGNCGAVTETCGACCQSSGTCVNDTNVSDCEASGGRFVGVGSVCFGDGDGNGVDDVCEERIPTVGGWGMMVLCLFLAAGLASRFGRRGAIPSA
jgi:hypothetical protein